MALKDDDGHGDGAYGGGRGNDRVKHIHNTALIYKIFFFFACV
jgi:hypothetical protein